MDLARPAALVAAVWGWVVFSSCSGDVSPGKADAQEDPRALVEAFFQALEKGDAGNLERLMEPGRLQKLQQRGGLQSWMEQWRKHKVLKVGEVLTEKDAGGSFPASVRVRVEYDRPGADPLVDSVQVTRVDQRWYWDEN